MADDLDNITLFDNKTNNNKQNEERKPAKWNITSEDKKENEDENDKKHEEKNDDENEEEDDEKNDEEHEEKNDDENEEEDDENDEEHEEKNDDENEEEDDENDEEHEEKDDDENEEEDENDEEHEEKDDDENEEEDDENDEEHEEKNDDENEEEDDENDEEHDEKNDDKEWNNTVNMFLAEHKRYTRNIIGYDRSQLLQKFKELCEFYDDDDDIVEVDSDIQIINYIRGINSPINTGNITEIIETYTTDTSDEYNKIVNLVEPILNKIMERKDMIYGADTLSEQVKHKLYIDFMDCKTDRDAMIIKLNENKFILSQFNKVENINNLTNTPHDQLKILLLVFLYKEYYSSRELDETQVRKLFWSDQMIFESIISSKNIMRLLLFIPTLAIAILTQILLKPELIALIFIWVGAGLATLYLYRDYVKDYANLSRKWLGKVSLPCVIDMNLPACNVFRCLGKCIITTCGDELAGDVSMA